MGMTSQEQEYQELLAKLPSRAPIYLPTEKIPLEDKIRGVRHVIQIYKHDLDAVYRPRLRALREQFKGRKRCFLIGNGPSLNETDLSVLKDEVTFAVNGFFLKAKDLDWKPTFYLVEYHLVAEDRAAWINEFKGPIKLFPAYLGYMFEADEDTVFYNHRPRKSYPHGFDFSMEADKITYTGCTVTFSMMQIAAYLGFEEIYLIGVDASYAIPEDAKESKDYGVGVLDMKSDDPNHFDPNYFGKGFRWHDPQVDKMVEAYTEARRTLEGTGQMIYNAGIGGQLEVFERRPFHDLFPHARSPEDVKANGHLRRYPRLLMLDMTPFANGTATGEIKANLFAGWPADQLLQIARHGKDGLALSKPDGSGGYVTTPCSEQAAREAALSFDADAVLYRPVPDVPWLHSLAMSLLHEIGKPVVAWVMDDWPRDLAERDPEQWRVLEPDLNLLLEHAQARLSICESMSSAFEARYGAPFTPLANGVRISDWPERAPHSGRRLRIRYAGGLAANMQRASVLRLARAVERLGKAGNAVSLEINTQPWWLREAKDDFSGFEFTSVTDETRPLDVYREWLRRADAVVIAYNFDEATLRYVRYSMANKMPECLASGAVLLAHGPADAATIGYLKDNGLGMVVDQEDEGALERALVDLMNDPGRRQALGRAARTFAFENHNLDTLHETLRQLVVDASASGAGGLPKPVRRTQPDTPPPPRPSDVHVLHQETPAPQRPVQESAPVKRPAQEREMSGHADRTVVEPAGLTPPRPPLSRPWYAPAGDALRRLAPGLFPTLQNTRRTLWRAGGSTLLAIAGLAALAALAFAAFGPGLLGSRLVLAGALLGASLLIGLGALGWRLRRAVQTLSAENRRLADDIARIHELAAGRERRVERLVNDQRDFDDRLVQYRGAQARSTRDLEDRLIALNDEQLRTVKTLKVQISRTGETLKGEIARSGEAARLDAEAVLRAQLTRLEARQARAAQALKEEIAQAGLAARSGAEDTLRAELARLEAEQIRTADLLKDEIVRASEAARAGAESDLRAELAKLEAEQARTADSLKDEIARASEAAQSRSTAELRGELERLEGEQAQTANALKEEIARAAQSARSGAQTDLRGELARLETQQARAAELLKEEIARASQAAQSGAEAHLRAELGRLEAEQARIANALKGQIAEAGRNALTGGEAALRAELSALEARLSDDNSAKATALRDELASLQAALEQKLSARAAVTTASFGRAAQAAKQREAELREQIEAMQQALKRAEAEALSAHSAATQGDNALREELKAIRQGLEQRLRAEVDEATAESIGRLTERFEAVAMTAGESDAKLRREIDTLRSILDADVKAPLAALQTTSKQALEIATGTQKTVSTFRKTGTMLQERVTAAERQIGAIKYPDAPDVFVFFGHHKCGSRFFRNEVFGRIAESTGARVRSYKIANPPHHYSRLDDLDLPNIDFSDLGQNGRDVVLFANATQRSLDKIRRTAGDWRGLRIIRDPRQVLISNYFHHKGDHHTELNGWVWDQLKQDKPILNELSKEDGILYELDNISKHVIEDLLLAPFDDERVLTLRLEDFAARPAAHLEQIARFLNVPDVAGIDLASTHANPGSSPWPQNFTSRIREAFKERYGQALIDLGYEEDMDW